MSKMEIKEDEKTASLPEENFTPHEERQASPISGCLIFSILLGCMLFLVLACTLFYFKTKRTIHLHSDTTQEKTKTERLVNTRLTKVKDKFTQFSKEVREGKKTRLELSVQEINLAIASYTKLHEFRGALFVTGVEGEHFTANVSLPVRGGLFEPNRYIHGTAKIKPIIADKSFFPKFVALHNHDGKELPEFLRQESNKGMVSNYKNDPDIADVFQKLTNSTIENGALVILSDPKSTPIVEGDPEVGLHNFLTGLSIFGILFFIFFSSAVFIYWMKKKKKAKTSA